MMKQLKKWIERLLKNDEITDPKEHEILQYLPRTKKWNPYWTFFSRNPLGPLKTPEHLSDEDYKVAPTNADEEGLNKQRAPSDKREQQATGKNYQLPTETKVKEELKEGVE